MINDSVSENIKQRHDWCVDLLGRVAYDTTKVKPEYLAEDFQGLLDELCSSEYLKEELMEIEDARKFDDAAFSAEDELLLNQIYLMTQHASVIADSIDPKDATTELVDAVQKQCALVISQVRDGSLGGVKKTKSLNVASPSI
jgi:hypothetical protein